MKKSVLILASLFALSACRNNDDDVQQESVVGVWKIQKSEVVSGQDNKRIISSEVPDDCEKKSTYEFTADYKILSREFELQNDVCKVLDTDYADYTFDFNTKKIIIDGGDASNVETLNKKMFIFSNSDSDYNGDGVNDTSRIYLVK